MTVVKVTIAGAGWGSEPVTAFRSAVIYEDRDLTLREKAKKLLAWVLRRRFDDPRPVAMLDFREAEPGLLSADMSHVPPLQPGQTYKIEW